MAEAKTPRPTKETIELLDVAADILAQARESTNCPICRQEIEVVEKAVRELREMVAKAAEYAEAAGKAQHLKEIEKRYMGESRASEASFVEEFVKSVFGDIYSTTDRRIRRRERREGFLDRLLDFALYPLKVLEEL